MPGLFDGTAFERPVLCDRCDKPEEDCKCPEPVEVIERVPPEKQKARVAVEKRKRGKTVTVIRGLHEADLPELLTLLKNKCGAGGTVQQDMIEIQGKHVDRICDELKTIGYRVQ